jgi:putative membrane protein
MSTLVVCVDRNGDIERKTGLSMPVSGWEAVRSLVTDIGLADPEDSAVNSLLEALRVARELHDDNEEATVAVISGTADSIVGADRAIAHQTDQLIADHDPDSAIIVIDSAQDERLVPIIESRIAVDAVDRVVVRQARDLESTYYLLKQFLADEELRQTILVPIGVALLTFPILLMVWGPAVATAAITAVIGLFVLYKGIGVDDYLADLPGEARNALYSGRVSIVTYVVAAGLSLIGLFAGALRVSHFTSPSQDVLMTTMAFAFDSVPWLAVAALAVSTGRLLDEAIRNDRVRNSYLNLPFGVVAVGIVDPLVIPHLEVGTVAIEQIALSPGTRLAGSVILGVLVSLLGVRVATYVSGETLEEEELPE